MEETKIFLKNLLAKSFSKSKIFKRNILKEYLQVLVLDFIYSHSQYSRLIFYGGSCLAHCYGLPRLSEDLDFVDFKKEINIVELSKDLKDYFKRNTDLDVITSVQKFRIYLKFPILYDLGLSSKGESNLLFLKIEIFSGFNFCQVFKIDTIPLFKFNKSILIRTFDISTLFSTKIRAILYRQWEKTAKSGKTIIRVKGRDYFDLMWYLEKGIEPNLKCIENIKDRKELRETLLKIINKIDKKSIRLDLEPLIENQNFVKNFSKNIKEILKKKIEANL